jgi:hypothetical protein
MFKLINYLLDKTNWTDNTKEIVIVVTTVTIFVLTCFAVAYVCRTHDIA